MINLEIHHADCQKCKTLENIAKYAEYKKENENNEMQVFEKSIEHIFNKVKKELEYSLSRTNAETCLIMEDDFIQTTIKTFRNEKYIFTPNPKKVIETVIKLLEKAGYLVTFYEYSTSWQHKSKKHGYFTIKW